MELERESLESHGDNSTLPLLEKNLSFDANAIPNVNPSDLCTVVSMHGENALFVSPANTGDANTSTATVIAVVITDDVVTSLLITAMEKSFRADHTHGVGGCGAVRANLVVSC